MRNLEHLALSTRIVIRLFPQPQAARWRISVAQRSQQGVLRNVRQAVDRELEGFAEYGVAL